MSRLMDCGCPQGQCKGHPVATNGLHAPTLLENAARFVCGLVEQKAGMKPGAIYNKGLGDFVKEAIADSDIPKEHLSIPDWLRRAGVLPERRER